MTPPTHKFDEEMMKRAIRLAMNGRGRVEPNPLVGAVLVKNGNIIAEGFHANFGGPHAEPTALAASCRRHGISRSAQPRTSRSNPAVTRIRKPRPACLR